MPGPSRFNPWPKTLHPTNVQHSSLGELGCSGDSENVQTFRIPANGARDSQGNVFTGADIAKPPQQTGALVPISLRDAMLSTFCSCSSLRLKNEIYAELNVESQPGSFELGTLHRQAPEDVRPIHPSTHNRIFQEFTLLYARAGTPTYLRGSLTFRHFPLGLTVLSAGAPS